MGRAFLRSSVNLFLTGLTGRGFPGQFGLGLRAGGWKCPDRAWDLSVDEIESGASECPKI